MNLTTRRGLNCLALCLVIMSCDVNEDNTIPSQVNDINFAEYVATVSDAVVSYPKIVSIKDKNVEVKEFEVFRDSLQLNTVFRIPSIFLTDKGTILLSCENRALLHDEGVMDILIARKEAGASSWDIMKVFKYNEEKGRSMDPVFAAENTGAYNRIYIMVGQFRDNRDCLYSTSDDIDFVYKYSDDDGRTWSDEVSIKEFWDTTSYDGAFPAPANGITDDAGTLYIPLYVQKEGITYSGIAYKKKGENWSFSKKTMAGDNESTVYIGLDGAIMLDCRTIYKYRRKYIYNIEKDTFTLQPWSFNNNVNLKAEITQVRYKGRQFFLMPYVDSEMGLRENLTLYGSKDGNEWKKIYRIYEGRMDSKYGDNYGYSNIAWNDNNAVITYETEKAVYCQEINNLKEDIFSVLFQE